MKLHISSNIYIHRERDEDHVYCLLLLSLYKIFLAHALRDLKASQLLMLAPIERNLTTTSLNIRDEYAGADCDVKTLIAIVVKWDSLILCGDPNSLLVPR